jgi:serine/threonine protein kinase
MEETRIRSGYVLAGRYQLLEKLGQGACGVVFSAKDIGQIGGVVAIKILPAELWRGPKDLRRFTRESNVARAIDHPNVLKVFDTGFSEGSHFHVMEYCPGGTLKDVMTANVLSESQAVAIMIALAHGLHELHSKRILHRDLKSTNVLLGDDGNFKIADFGLARWDSSDMTQTRSIGTPTCLAPEIWNGEGSTVLTDIYALGVVFYELLTGQLPFQASSVAALAQSHIYDVPTPPSKIVPCSPRLESIIGRMLAKNKYERSRDITQVIVELELLRGGDVRVDSPDELLSRGVSRIDLRAIAKFSVVLVFVFFFAFLCAFLVPESTLIRPHNSFLSYMPSATLNHLVIHFELRDLSAPSKEESWEIYESIESIKVESSGAAPEWVLSRHLANGSRLLGNLFMASDGSIRVKQINCVSERKPKYPCFYSGYEQPTFIASVPGEARLNGAYPVAAWSTNDLGKGTTRVMVSRAWKFGKQLYWPGVGNVPWVQWPRALTGQDKLLKSDHFKSLLEPSFLLLIRHEWGCRDALHPLERAPEYICEYFSDHLYAKDQEMNPLGMILMVQGRLEGRAREMEVDYIQITKGLEGDS